MSLLVDGLAKRLAKLDISLFVAMNGIANCDSAEDNVITFQDAETAINLIDVVLK
jgi:hypothetical protein